MMDWLSGLGSLLSFLGGVVAFGGLWLRAQDRRQQREALMQAKDNPELQKALTESLPPLTGWLFLLLASGALGAAFAVARTADTRHVAEEARKKCDKSTCKPPSYCVGDVCESAAMPHPAGAKPKAKMPTQRAENLTVHEPSSWGLDVRPAWADRLPPPLERPDAD